MELKKRLKNNIKPINIKAIYFRRAQQSDILEYIWTVN